MDDVGALKEVSSEYFFQCNVSCLYSPETWWHSFLIQLQSLIKTEFCSTEDYHDEACNTAVIFSLHHEMHLIIGVSVWDFIIYLQAVINNHLEHYISLYKVNCDTIWWFFSVDCLLDMYVSRVFKINLKFELKFKVGHLSHYHLHRGIKTTFSLTGWWTLIRPRCALLTLSIIA